MSSVSGAMAAGQWQVAVARQQLNAIEQQGKDALDLIKSATEPQAAPARPANVAASVGANLNVVA